MTTGGMYLSNCNIDYIETCNNDNILDEISLFIFVMIFPYFLAFLLIFMNMQIIQI